ADTAHDDKGSRHTLRGRRGHTSLLDPFGYLHVEASAGVGGDGLSDAEDRFRRRETAMSGRDDKIEIENFTSPGRTYRVDRAKYEAMRDALLGVLPADAPGLTVAEAKAKLLPLLPDDL